MAWQEKVISVLFFTTLCSSYVCAAGPLIKETKSRSNDIATSTTSSSSNEKTLYANDDSQCGGVLDVADEPMMLSYKMEKPKERYESCVWTIHAVNRTIIKLNIINPISWDNGDSISVGYFLNSNYGDINSFKWKKVPGSTIPLQIEVPGPVAFVHYSSEYNRPIFGFRLFASAGGKQMTSNYTFKNYFLQGEYGLFDYPPLGSRCTNHKVTVVVKADPGNAVQGKDDPSWYQMISKVKDGDKSCESENLNLFGYGVGQEKWFKNETICGTSVVLRNLNYAPRNDPVIFTFNSGSKGAEDGFEVRWMNRHY